MKVLFIIQGEGRGHLTQALSLAQILRSAGHELAGALVGVADDRPVQAFFASQIQAPVWAFVSPSLQYNPKTNALDLLATTRQVIRHLPNYWRSLRFIDDAIRQHRPDVVVNFYDVLGGLTYAHLRPQVPMVCVAHQYLLLHPHFPHPKGHRLDRFLVNFNTWLTSLGAQRRLALSFVPMPDQPEQQLTVVPPLLRQEVVGRNPADMGTGEPGYLLAYVSQDGLGRKLLDAHRAHPELPIRCFKGGLNEAVEQVDDTFTFHRIDGQAFLDQMESCRAVVTTAGFESICEAMYLGKPVLMMPMPNHYEQLCNAHDAEQAGAGVISERLFDLQKLLDYLPRHRPETSPTFRQWQQQCARFFLKHLELAAQSVEAPPSPVIRPVYGTTFLRRLTALR